MVLTLCTTNPDKAALLRACCAELGIETRQAAVELSEPQADSIAAVASAKVTQAFAQLGGPVIVEDSGLAIESLRGFPGAYTKYALATIGARGLVALAGGQACRFTSALALARSDGTVVTAQHEIRGAIAAHVAERCDGSWSDLWSIFIAEGDAVPFSELPAAARGAHLGAWRAAITSWLRAQDLG